MSSGGHRIEPGQTVCHGRYRVLSILGRGEFGSVYLAQGPRALVALKVVSTQGWNDRVYRAFNAHIVREASLLQSLSHSALPRLIEFQAEGADYFLAMDWVRGITLDRLVAQRGPLSLSEALSFLSQAGALLSYLQQTCSPPIVLGDIKPQNLLLDDEGRLRFVDLGLAGPVGSLPIEGYTAYTPGFSAPERETGAASELTQDLYSLAATFLFACTGSTVTGFGTADLRPGRIREALLQRAPTGAAARSAFRRLTDRLLVALDPEPEQRGVSLESLRDGIVGCCGALQREADSSGPDRAQDLLGRLYRDR